MGDKLADDWVQIERNAKGFREESRTFMFPPGEIGMVCDSAGKVTKVQDGLAKDAGVKVGWKIVAISRMPYHEELLDALSRESMPYPIIFSIPQEVIVKRDDWD